MKAGIGRCDITPPLGVELAGYGYYLHRCAESVTDPLYARALYVEDGAEKLLLVSCELLGLSGQAAAKVRSAMAKHGLAGGQVMLVSIHTHTGPCVIYHLGCGEVSPDYVETLAGKIINACEQAMADAHTVKAIQAAMHTIAGRFAYNRASAQGPVDSLVRGFVVEREAASPIAVVSYACHAVSRGRVTGVSADYPGAVNAMMAQKGFAPIYVNGLCGDIDPWVPEGQSRDEQLHHFASAIEAAFTSGLQPVPVTLETGQVSAVLALSRLTKDEIRQAADKEAARCGEESAPGRIARAWENELMENYDRLQFEEPLQIPYFRLGGRLVMALPFEGFTQIGVDIRRELHAPEAIVLGCAEQLRGYLATRDDVERGGYAALESTFLYRRLPPAPGEAERFALSLAREMKQIRK